MKPEWLLVTADDLDYELRQLRDQGKDVSELEEEFEELKATIAPDNGGIERVEDRVDVVLSSIDSDRPLEHRDEVNALLDRARELPERANYPYNEPTDLESIRVERPDGPRRLDVDSIDELLEDRLYGAWLGRCAGCLLGKPVEGWSYEKIQSFLKATDQYPLTEYVRSDIPEGTLEEFDIDPDGVFSSCINEVEHMPEDDDTNYTVAGLSLLDNHGAKFTAEDVARFWMRNVPILRTHTAERVAIRNLANLIAPPESARHRNPYREWIGAQIRADPYGYVALGDPERAAELAWRDARVSHIKNGVYGSMWVAAMTAVAPFTESMTETIEIGLTEIPANSRLTDAITDVLNWYDEGIDYEEAVERIHDRWDDSYYHHWCHTISNAEIVAVGLLWGEGDLGRSMCRAVNIGFDTDSHCATVGSIVGMTHGASKLPEQWVDPLNDTIETGIDGYQRVPISRLAEDTLEIYDRIR